MAQPRFGELLWSAIYAFRAISGQKITPIKMELAELCYVSVEAIQRYRKKSLPESRNVTTLARWGVENAKMDRQWLRDFLEAGEYYDGGQLEKMYFGDDRSKAPIIDQRLPPLPTHFIGRTAEILLVVEGLGMPHPLLSIEGMGGNGKTSLVIKIAQMCQAGQFPTIPPFEKVVWISAKDKADFDLSLAEVLDAIGETLRYTYVDKLSGERKRKAVNDVLRKHRTLIIVDNFDTVTDIGLADFLQRIPPPSKGIITTREPILRRLWDVSLDGLPEEEALQKIRDYAYSIGLRKLAQEEDDSLQPLVKVTDGNPKAIEFALGYIRRQDFAFDEVVQSLGEANVDVEELFDDLFARAWQLLSPEAKRILMVMHFFADSASRDALGATANVQGTYLRTALSQLRDLSFIDDNEALRQANKRYSAHPLVLAFARKHFNHLLFEEQDNARVRWANYLIDVARQHLVRDIPTERYWNTLLHRDRHSRVVDRELSNLYHMLDWIIDNGKDDLLVEAMMIMTHYLGTRSSTKRIHYCKPATEAAKRLGWRTDETLLHIDALGWMCIEAGLYDEAIFHIQVGKQIAMTLEYPQAKWLSTLADAFLSRVYLAQGKQVKAAETYDRIGSIDDLPNFLQYRVHAAGADIAARCGNLQTAKELLEMVISVGSEYGEELHYDPGYVYLNLEEYDRAETFLQSAMQDDSVASELTKAYATYGMARVALHRNQVKEARKYALQAREMLSWIDIYKGALAQDIDALLTELQQAE